LLACAKIVSEKYHGLFPRDTEALQKLPGIGPYTAQAIRAFVYDIPTLSFDTNLEKVFSRYYFGSRFVKFSPSQKAEITDQFVQSGLSSRIINGALMDFATIVSKNSKYTVEHAESPFQNCLFKITQGELDIVTKKPITYFPRKDSQIEVILHKNHSVYYSSSTTEYCPFILPPTQSDIRKYVQEYFRTTHGLEISVRPIHLQEYRNDVPYISMYAQIQTGISNFKTYSSTAGASEIGTKSQRIRK
jgi:A/G-specific adenine glycosylase